MNLFSEYHFFHRLEAIYFDFIQNWKMSKRPGSDELFNSDFKELDNVSLQLITTLPYKTFIFWKIPNLGGGAFPMSQN